jgi:hypothetical protein
VTPDPGGRLPDPARSAAVLIGCSRYTHLPALPAVSTGLRDLRAALTDPVTGGFAATACQVIAEPADGGSLAAVLLDVARTTHDTLLVYYCGHGVLDSANRLHLALTGTRQDQALVPTSSLAFDHLRTILKDSPARNRVVILDCCYAGRAIHDMAGPDLAAQAVITGSYVLTATDADKTARASDGVRHTAFTGALLDLLNHGIPQGPDLLTLDSLFPYLRTALVGREFPAPRRQGTDTIENIALTRNPAARAGPAHPPGVDHDSRPPPDARTPSGPLARSLRLFPRILAGRTIGPRSRAALLAGIMVVIAAVAIPVAIHRSDGLALPAASAPATSTAPTSLSPSDHPPDSPPAPPIPSGAGNTCKSSADGLQLTSPSCPWDTLRQPYYVIGTVSGLAAGERVWVLLWATDQKTFYLVDESPNRFAADSNGNLCSSIGVDLTQRGWFYVYAVIVDKKYSDTLAGRTGAETATADDVRSHGRAFAYLPVWSTGRSTATRSSSPCTS